MPTDLIWCEPLNKGIYGLSSEEIVNIPLAPGSLDEALSALKEDHEFLLKGDVFTEGEAAHLDLWAISFGHRGPNDRGIYSNGNAVLGQTRLFLVDVVYGHQ